MVTNGPQRERSLLEAEESLSEVTAPAAVMTVPQSSDLSPTAQHSVNPVADLYCDPVIDQVNRDFATLNYSPQNDPQLDQLSVPAFSQALRTDIKQEKLQRGVVKEFSSARRQQAKQRLQRIKNRQRAKQPKKLAKRGDGTILDILVSALADALKSLDNAIFRRKPVPEVVRHQQKVQKTGKHHDRHHTISTGFFGDASKEQDLPGEHPSVTLSTARQND